MFVSTPETTAWVAFAKPGVRLKHLFAAVGFEHGFSGLNGVFFRDVDWKMDVTSAEAEVTEFKAETFEIPERLSTGVNMRLFQEAVVVAFGLEHHGDPVVSCVNRWFFMATANYINHSVFFFPVAPLKSRRMPAACDKKVNV